MHNAVGSYPGEAVRPIEMCVIGGTPWEPFAITLRSVGTTTEKVNIQLRTEELLLVRFLKTSKVE